MFALSLPAIQKNTSGYERMALLNIHVKYRRDAPLVIKEICMNKSHAVHIIVL